MVFALGVILIAHRAGNDPGRVAECVDVADMVELDVHLWRGRLEIRHAKRIWIFQRLWEQWRLLPRSTPVPSLAEVLSAAPDRAPLLVDLKGWSPKLPARVRGVLGEARPVAVSARAWWLLRGFRDRPDTTTLRSVGTKWQLWLAMKLPPGDDAIVIHQRLLDRVSVVRLVDRYQTVFTWNVETEDRAVELIEMGVSGLIIDDLGLIEVLRNQSVAEPTRSVKIQRHLPTDS